MPEVTNKKLRRRICERMYVELDISISDCADVMGVSDGTIYKWMRKANWQEKKVERQVIDGLLNINLKRALCQCLQSYANDPTDKSTQDLLNLLMQFKEHYLPSLTDKENILKSLTERYATA